MSAASGSSSSPAAAAASARPSPRSCGRTGAFVVTVDPLVTLDGSEQLPEPEETTAGRIVAAGGAARASAVSVTDGAGVRRALRRAGRRARRARRRGQRRRHHPADQLRHGHRGGLAQRARGAPRRLPQRARRRAAAHGRGRARSHPRRHLRIGVAAGRRRCLRLRQAGRRRPHLAAGPARARGRRHQRHLADRRHPHGHRGARAACRKTGGARHRRAVPWARCPRPRTSARSAPTSSATDFAWCRGRVLFAGGSEVAVVDEPRLLEVVRTDDVARPPQVLEAVTTTRLAQAEANQASGGGSNPRFGRIFDEPDRRRRPGRRSAVVRRRHRPARRGRRR